MITYTETQTQEMVADAVANVERSFGGTLQRLKEENERLQKLLKEKQQPAEQVVTLTYRNFAEVITEMAMVGIVSVEFDENLNGGTYVLVLEVHATKAATLIAEFSGYGLMPITLDVEKDKAFIGYWSKVLHEE